MLPTFRRAFPGRNRRLAATAFAVAAVACVLGTTVGASVPAGAVVTDARTQRSTIRAEQARVASQVDALQGTQAQVIAALNALDENVRGQEAIVSEARRQADASAAEAAQASRNADATSRELDQLRSRVAKYAVQAYVDPPGEAMMRRFEAGSAQEDATRRALLDMQSRNDADSVDQLRVTKSRFEEELKRATDANDRAEAQAAQAEQALGALSSAKSQQQTFAEQVRQRLDDRLSDSAYLSKLDVNLGASIAAEEAALIGAVSRVPAPTPGDSSGGGSGGSMSPPPTTPPGQNPVAHPPLTTVGGITVATTIAEPLRAMLNAASSDGINLGGSGYRDINVQIQLRRQNCGYSDYAVWQMPADSCSPPTARPGLSWHERGLAIDFTANGSFINSHSNPAFVWLAANASRFGFTNLPSEPWHWSNPG
jgi:LAS superfamily LD-carboxypeptidase LdcB